MSSIVNPFAKIVASTLPVVLGTRGRQRLTVLIYHRVLAEPDPMFTRELVAPEFEWQMKLLANHFNPMSLEAALAALAGNSLPERAVCVTFDDGYSDNEQVAMPILKRCGVPATVFVATDYLNGGMMWNDTVCEAIRVINEEVIDLTNFGLGIVKVGSIQDKRLAVASIVSEIKHWDNSKRSDTAQGIKSFAGSMRSGLMMTDEQVRNLYRNGVEVGAHTKSHPILAKIDISQATPSGNHESAQKLL